MLATKAITKAMHNIVNHLPFLAGINSEKDYEDALMLMDELIEDYDNNIVLIEALSNVIYRYEQTQEAFEVFNKRVEGIDPATATFRVLMEQHELRQSDFENEVGKKSSVSLILAGKRNLTREHIQKLSERFNVKPSLFF